MAYNLGFALLKLKQPHDAIPHFRKATTLEPAMANATVRIQ